MAVPPCGVLSRRLFERVDRRPRSTWRSESLHVCQCSNSAPRNTCVNIYMATQTKSIAKIAQALICPAHCRIGDRNFAASAPPPPPPPPAPRAHVFVCHCWVMHFVVEVPRPRHSSRPPAIRLCLQQAPVAVLPMCFTHCPPFPYRIPLLIYSIIYAVYLWIRLSPRR